MPAQRTDGTGWPRISIITPSYNQGQFIEETIRSVLLQNYQDLEYIIIDGGSNDNTVDVIKKYEKWIQFWVSEKDNGQSEAINKGFNRSTGDLVNWICSDDLLCKNALNLFADQYFSANNYCYIGKCLLIDDTGRELGTTTSKLTRIEELLDLSNHWRNGDSIAQQSALYPLSTVKRIGGLRVSNHYTMDYELWGDLLINGIEIKNIPLEIGVYRWYEGQKTSFVNKATRSLVFTAMMLAKRVPSWTEIKKIRTKLSLLKYYFLFCYHQFRSFLGIKRRFSRVFTNGI